MRKKKSSKNKLKWRVLIMKFEILSIYTNLKGEKIYTIRNIKTGKIKQINEELIREYYLNGLI